MAVRLIGFVLRFKYLGFAGGGETGGFGAGRKVMVSPTLDIRSSKRRVPLALAP